jgi:hypothetical protein
MMISRLLAVLVLLLAGSELLLCAGRRPEALMHHHIPPAHLRSALTPVLTTVHVDVRLGENTASCGSAQSPCASLVYASQLSPSPEQVLILVSPGLYEGWANFPLFLREGVTLCSTGSWLHVFMAVSEFLMAVCTQCAPECVCV